MAASPAVVVFFQHSFSSDQTFCHSHPPFVEGLDAVLESFYEGPGEGPGGISPAALRLSHWRYY